MRTEITDSWNNYLNSFSSSQKDIYFTENYVKLYKTNDDIPLCFVYENDNNIMLMPFLRRSIDNYFDFETPYGYGGPIFNTTDTAFIEQSLLEMFKFFKDNNYVDGFVRFHPLLNNAHKCECIAKIIDDRKTISIDTSLSEEDIWMHEISCKNRSTIRKAQKNDLKFIADYEFKYINEFIELYNSTMDKLDADTFYYFDKHYYDEYIKNLSLNSFIGVVVCDSKIISAALFMYGDLYGHYHLSGSNKNHIKMCPNNLMLFEAAKEIKKHGVMQFHLGGGINSDIHNSLFEFKSHFGKTQHQFSIGKIIFNQDAYNNICAKWAEQNPQKTEKYKNYLLKYRY